MIEPQDLYDEHVVAIHAHVARRIGREGAADVVSEVFRIAIERLDSFDPELGSPRAWLHGIAANVLRHHWRSEQRRLRAIGRLAVEAIVPDESDAAARRVDADGDASRVMDAVAGLDPIDRDIVMLIAWEGASYAEVATALDIPTGTVRSRLHRIRAELRGAMSARTGSTKERQRNG